MSCNTNFIISGLTLEESNQIMGYIGNDNLSGRIFGEVYSRNPPLLCGHEEYTIKEFLSKKEQIIKEYEKEGKRTKEIYIGYSLLEKLFSPDALITVDWG